jgi:hypothetical protein
MYALVAGIVLWFVWLGFYWYDVSSFYLGGYRIRSDKVRDFVTGLFYTSLGLMCVGCYWLYIRWLLSFFIP